VGALDQHYLLKRFKEELELAEHAGDERERSVRLQACRHYSEMLRVLEEGENPSISNGS
jgi:hypothetical protein